MKKLISLVLAFMLLVLPVIVAEATTLPRLDLREGDDLVPYGDGQFFTRYTPWLKAYHPMTEAEVSSGVHGGEAYQQIRCIDISPVDNDLIIFGSDSSGVWITKNGGDFWYNTNRNITLANIADVMCHPTDKNVLFCYAIGTLSGASAPGIYRSEDMGRSWDLVYPDYITSSMADKLFAYDEHGNLYAATGHGVVKSSDSGKTWNVLLVNGEANSDTDPAAAYSIRVSANGNTILACYGTEGNTLNGLYFSLNGGEAWEKVSSLGNVTDYVAYAIEVDLQNPDRWILSARVTQNNGTYLYNLYLTSNKGESWTSFKNTDGSGWEWLYGNEYNTIYNQRAIRRLRMTEDYLYACYNNVDRAFRKLPCSEIAKASSTSKWEALDFKKDGILDADNTFSGESNMYFTQGVDIEGDTMFVCAAGPNKYTFSTGEWEKKRSGYSGISTMHFGMDEEGNMLLSVIDGNVVASTRPYSQASPATFTIQKNYNTTVATMAIRDKYEENRFIAWCGNANITKTDTGIIVSEDNLKTWSGYDGNLDTPDDLPYEAPIAVNTVVLEYSKDPAEPYTIFSSWATGTKNSPNEQEIWTENEYFYLDVGGENSERILAWDMYRSDGSAPTYEIFYREGKGEQWKQLTENLASSRDRAVRAFFDNSNPNIVWYKTLFDFGKIDITDPDNPKVTSYRAKSGYGNFTNLVQNPKESHHFILTIGNLYGESPVLMESIDHGESWYVVPGYFGRLTANVDAVTFSTTTNEVFIGGHSGMIVYEYEKFRYYQAVALVRSDKSTLLTTQPLYNGKIIAPDESYAVARSLYRFEGWEYNDILYRPGEEVTVQGN